MLTTSSKESLCQCGVYSREISCTLIRNSTVSSSKFSMSPSISSVCTPVNKKVCIRAPYICQASQALQHHRCNQNNTSAPKKQDHHTTSTLVLRINTGSRNQLYSCKITAQELSSLSDSYRYEVPVVPPAHPGSVPHTLHATFWTPPAGADDFLFAPVMNSRGTGGADRWY